MRGIARQDLPHTPDAEAPNRPLLPTWLLRVPRRRVLLYPQPEIPQQVMRLIPTRVELQLIVSVTASSTVADFAMARADCPKLGRPLQSESGWFDQ